MPRTGKGGDALDMLFSTSTSDAPWNNTGFSNTDFDRLYAARSQTDEAVRAGQYAEMQQDP